MIYILCKRVLNRNDITKQKTNFDPTHFVVAVKKQANTLLYVHRSEMAYGWGGGGGRPRKDQDCGPSPEQ